MFGPTNEWLECAAAPHQRLPSLSKEKFRLVLFTIMQYSQTFKRFLHPLFTYVKFTIISSLCHWCFSNAPPASPEVQDAYHFFFMLCDDQNEGMVPQQAPNTLVVIVTFFYYSFQYIMIVLWTASLTGNARTMLLVEWHLTSKCQLLLSYLPPQSNPRGMCKQVLTIIIASHLNRAHPYCWCPIAIGSQRCLHSMRTPLVLVAGPQGAGNSPLRNWLRCHRRSSTRRSQNVVERSDTMVNNNQ